MQGATVLNYLPIVLFVLVLAGIFVGRRGIFVSASCVAMLGVFALMLILFLVMVLRPHHYAKNLERLPCNIA